MQDVLVLLDLSQFKSRDCASFEIFSYFGSRFFKDVCKILIKFMANEQCKIKILL